jgi:hypothetical protein
LTTKLVAGHHQVQPAQKNTTAMKQREHVEETHSRESGSVNTAATKLSA